MFKPEFVLALQKPVLVRMKLTTPVRNYLAMYVAVCMSFVIFILRMASYVSVYVCMHV